MLVVVGCLFAGVECGLFVCMFVAVLMFVVVGCVDLFVVVGCVLAGLCRFVCALMNFVMLWVGCGAVLARCCLFGCAI